MEAAGAGSGAKRAGQVTPDHFMLCRCINIMNASRSMRVVPWRFPVCLCNR